MKKHLKIQSEGQIEIGAFTLIGASTKRNDQSKIGYYGSGLKYSLSSLIRNKINFRIFSGMDEVYVTTQTQNFRKDSFEVILVNGKETSLTTNMGGADWDLPFAPIREIYSNALDEDEFATLRETENITGCENKTTFYIEMTNDVQHFYDNVQLYFCNQNPKVLNANAFAGLYPQADDGEIRLYRKNILCYEGQEEKSLFTYNSKLFTINESRVLDNKWLAKRVVGNFWKSCTDESLINHLIFGLRGGNSGKYEHDIDYDSWEVKFSQEWHNVASKFKFVPVEMAMFCEPDDLEGRIMLPKDLLQPLFKQFDDLDVLGLSTGSDGVDFVEIKLGGVSPVLANKVLDALAVLNKTRYTHRLNDIKIKYVRFAKEKTLGLADDGIIYLSEKLDSYDVNDIAKILIEENEHNRSGHGDMTRLFQNHLFNLLFDELIA